MARALYVYAPLDVRLLEEVVESHVESFGEEIKDLFSDDELEIFHRQLDEMAPFSVSAKPHELQFDDFEADPDNKEKRDLFGRVHSLVVLENLPFLETNVFQVSSIRAFLERLPEVLVDEEGLGDLLSKDEYLQKIASLKGIETVLKEVSPRVAPVSKPSFIPVEPIDFLIRDVYQEMERILREKLLEKVLIDLRSEKETLKDLFFIVREGQLPPDELFKRSGLSAKNFDDDLEKLKFFLKRRGK